MSEPDPEWSERLKLFWAEIEPGLKDTGARTPLARKYRNAIDMFMYADIGDEQKSIDLMTFHVLRALYSLGLESGLMTEVGVTLGVAERFNATHPPRRPMTTHEIEFVASVFFGRVVTLPSRRLADELWATNCKLRGVEHVPIDWGCEAKVVALPSAAVSFWDRL